MKELEAVIAKIALQEMRKQDAMQKKGQKPTLSSDKKTDSTTMTSSKPSATVAAANNDNDRSSNENKNENEDDNKDQVEEDENVAHDLVVSELDDKLV